MTKDDQEVWDATVLQLRSMRATTGVLEEVATELLMLAGTQRSQPRGVVLILASRLLYVLANEDQHPETDPEKWGSAYWCACGHSRGDHLGGAWFQGEGGESMREFNACNLCECPKHRRESYEQRIAREKPRER
jgi:hypothetical protein